MKTSKKRK